MVPAETIVQHAIEEKVDMIGLSLSLIHILVAGYVDEHLELFAKIV